MTRSTQTGAVVLGMLVAVLLPPLVVGQVLELEEACGVIIQVRLGILLALPNSLEVLSFLPRSHRRAVLQHPIVVHEGPHRCSLRLQAPAAIFLVFIYTY